MNNSKNRTAQASKTIAGTTVHYEFTCPVCKTRKVEGSFNKAHKNAQGFISLQCSCTCGNGNFTGDARLGASSDNVDVWFDEPQDFSIGLKIS